MTDPLVVFFTGSHHICKMSQIQSSYRQLKISLLCSICVSSFARVSPVSSFWVIPEVFNGIEVWALTGSFQDFGFPFLNHVLVDFCGLWIIIVLKFESDFHPQRFDRGQMVLYQNI